MPNPAYADRIALAYLADRGIAAARVDGRVITRDGVAIKVLYSRPRRYRGFYFWMLPRPIICDVLMLITDSETQHYLRRFYLFDPDDDVFYYRDGRQKQALSWVDKRLVQRQHQARFPALTMPVMDAARDRLELIESARRDHMTTALPERT